MYVYYYHVIIIFCYKVLSDSRTKNSKISKISNCLSILLVM